MHIPIRYRLESASFHQTPITLIFNNESTPIATKKQLFLLSYQIYHYLCGENMQEIHIFNSQ